MAGKDKQGAKPVDGIPEGSIRELKLDKLDLAFNDLEFRVSPRIGDLVEDIARNGQQFPIIVRPIEGTYTYQIVSGYRRVRAIKQLGWPTVKAIVREDLDDDSAYRVSFLENERRKSLTGVDKAHAIAKLRLLGKTTGQIKELYGLGDKQVERYEKVNSFPKALKDAISEQRILTTHGLLLAQAHALHGDKLELKAWIDHVEAEELTVRQLGRALNGDFGKPKKKVRYFERRGKGFRLYPMSFDPKTTDDAARAKMLDTLRQALQMLEPAAPD